jgi:nucleotide-binding universal stress UspA family protein
MFPRIRKILVPLDFSPASDHALQYARRLGTDAGSSLHLLHVIEDRMLVGPWTTEVYLGELPRIRESLIRDAEARIREYASGIMKAGVEITTEILIGSPAHAIVESASAPDVDLIVMGTHGRTGVVHFLLGSVAERVVRHAPCPVLVVRERKVASLSAEPTLAEAGVDGTCDACSSMN